jgi:hypothetical protein
MLPASAIAAAWATRPPEREMLIAGSPFWAR